MDIAAIARRCGLSREGLSRHLKRLAQMDAADSGSEPPVAIARVRPRQSRTPDELAGQVMRSIVHLERQAHLADEAIVAALASALGAEFTEPTKAAERFRSYFAAAAGVLAGDDPGAALGTDPTEVRNASA